MCLILFMAACYAVKVCVQAVVSFGRAEGCGATLDWHSGAAVLYLVYPGSSPGSLVVLQKREGLSDVLRPAKPSRGR